MNIVSVLNKLKEAKMIVPNEEGVALFSDCFTKFGVSLLLLKDEDKFNTIVNELVEAKIPLQKSNGIYNLRVFAVEVEKLKEIISAYTEIGEIDFLRRYPETLAATYNVQIILENMKKYQSDQVTYKVDNEYNMELLLADNEVVVANENNEVNEYLKTLLEDKTLVDKVVNNIKNPGEEDFDVALELQKVENKICEEFLFPVDDGWKIIIDKKEVNSFQDVKDTINTIIKLNIPVTFDDALKFVLFYKTSLSVTEIEEILDNNLIEGGM